MRCLSALPFSYDLFLVCFDTHELLSTIFLAPDLARYVRTSYIRIHQFLQCFGYG